MKTTSSPISLCRHCQYFSPEGRRGGHCQKLNVSVKSRWEACSLGVSPFVSPWKEFENITGWKQRFLEQERFLKPIEQDVNYHYEKSLQSVPITVPVQ